MHSTTWRTYVEILSDQTPPDNAPFGGDDSDMGSEDAYDLRDLNSDIEMDAEELDDARYE